MANKEKAGALRKHVKVLLRWLICLAVVSETVAQAQERFEVLHVGAMSYTNVLVLNKTPADLFITHAQGLSNIKVRDLDPTLAGELGYNGEGTARPKPRLSLPKLEMSPDVERIQAKLGEDVTSRLRLVSKGIALAAMAFSFVFYFFMCNCCRLICDKAGAPSSFMVWVPGLQMFALYRAAGMSPWLALGMFAPHVALAGVAQKLTPQSDMTDPANFVLVALLGLSLLIPLVLHTIWCVKIARAREKSGLVAFALWFPLTSFFAFLYLAFSGTGEPEAVESDPRPNYVTFS